MANKRIKDLAATATSPAVDDFIAIDGVTNNTRKIAADSFLQDAPEDGDLYGREDGAWDVAASVDSLPLTPTFVYDNNIGDTEFVVGNIPSSWQSNNADLTQLSIGNSATSIGSGAFYYCTGFTGDLTIPNSVTTIGSDAFRSCSGFTGDLTIPNSVTTIGSDAFRSCSGFTGSLTIGNSVTSIGGYAFAYSDLTSVTIPNSVTTIGGSAFTDNYLSSVTIPNSVTTISGGAFLSNSLSSVTIPNSVTSIGYGAFRYNATLATVNCLVTKTIIDAESDIFADSADPLTINARASDGTWTAGTGLSIGGNANVTVVKNL